MSLRIRQYLRVGVVSSIFAIVLFVVNSSVWDRYLAAVGYEVMASFFAILCIAVILLHQRGEVPSAPFLLVGGFSYYAIIELGGAIGKLLVTSSPLIQKTNIVLASDLIELACFGATILLGIVLHLRSHNLQNKTNKMLILPLIVGPLLIHGLMRLFILYEIPDAVVTLTGLAAGLTGIVLFLAAGMLITKNVNLFPQNGPVHLFIALILMASSSIPSIISLYVLVPIWTMTIIMQLIAFINIYLALAPVFLAKFSVPKERALFLSLVAMMLMIIPFLITLISESIFPELEIINLGAYLVSTLGFTSMAAALAVLIFTYAKRTGKMYQYPLAFFFSVLTMAGVSNLLLSPLFQPVQIESMSALILVSIFSIPALVQAIRWMGSSPIRKNGRPVGTWLAFAILGSMCLFVLGEILQYTFLRINPTFNDSPVGGIVVLALSAFTIGEGVYLAFLILGTNRGRITIEVLSIGFLSLWIIQSILKAIFLAWTAGWWLGEVLLLIGFLVGPTLIGYLYLGSFLSAEESGTRAMVYSDILAHDISNHHQAILSGLEIAMLEITPDDLRKRALSDAYLALVDADRLARNVRKLGLIDANEISNFYPIDLVSNINDSFIRLTKAYRSPDIILNLETEEEECYILANDLLQDIFLNLFRNAIEYSEKGRIDVRISRTNINSSAHWEIRVIDFGPGIAYEMRDSLFSRYMKGAKGSGLGLSVVKALVDLFRGSIRIEDRLEGDFSKGSVFVLRFPISAVSKQSKPDIQRVDSS
ncbi:MAG: sensor histidine kinase [Candidatus Thorarchaeota archaeon]